jgi:hypothetical protein
MGSSCFFTALKSISRLPSALDCHLLISIPKARVITLQTLGKHAEGALDRVQFECQALPRDMGGDEKLRVEKNKPVALTGLLSSIISRQ